MLFLESVFIVVKITGNRVLTTHGLKVENGRLFGGARIRTELARLAELNQQRWKYASQVLLAAGFIFLFLSVSVGVKALCNRRNEDCNVLELALAIVIHIP
jgi:hypothetical protein